MKITKFGHCCLLLEIDGARLLTDPGLFTQKEAEGVQGVDAVLITHEHTDHFHIESVKMLLRNNPAAEIICNGSVAKLLQKDEIPATVVGDGESTQWRGILIEGFGKKHATIYQDVGQVENTGYFVAEKFYFPGDAFHNPQKPVDILALPVAGPWMKISEAIDFCHEVNPRVTFGVHDGMMKPGFNFNAFMAANVLGPQFVTLADGESREF